MSLKKSLMALTLLTAVAFPPAAATLRAGDTRTGQLVINILPEVLVTAPAAIAATATPLEGGASWLATFELPVEVKIRLAKGASAELAIEPIPDPTVASSLQGELAIGGVATPINTGSPATVLLTASGTRQLAAGITLRGDATAPSGSLPVRLALRSSDGTLNWTSTTELRWLSQQ